MGMIATVVVMLFDASKSGKTLKYVNKNFDDYCLNGIFRSESWLYTHLSVKLFEIVNSEAL